MEGKLEPFASCPVTPGFSAIVIQDTAQTTSHTEPTEALLAYLETHVSKNEGMSILEKSLMGCMSSLPTPEAGVEPFL